MTRREPLIPPGVDLSGLEYMPLYIAKLRASKAWLICKRKPQLAYYLMNLWMRAWQEVPAGSLEDDDDVLADAAGCASVEDWAEVKADALRGWQLCSDGRLYLPSMVEMVRRGWELVQTNKRRGKAGAKARWGTNSNASDIASTHAPSMPQAHVTDAQSMPSNMAGREGGKEVRKERAHSGAKINGKPPEHPRAAFLESIASRRGNDATTHGITNPWSLQIIDELGGYQTFRELLAANPDSLRERFELRYRELAAQQH